MAEIVSLVGVGAALIVTIGGAVTVIVNWLRPAKKFADRVKDLEAHDARDYIVINDIKETNKLLCKGIICLLDNKITNNSIDKLKEVKEEIQQHLIKKA